MWGLLLKMKPKKIKLKIVGNYGGGYSSKNVYDSNGLAPTLKAGNNHGLGVVILVYEEIKVKK